VTLNDTYGLATDSGNYTLDVPGTIYLKNESNPGENLSAATNATITFYTDDGVTRRNVTTNAVNLSGLAPGAFYEVVLDAEGFYRRRLTLDTLADQQTAYLLPKSADAAELEFVLVDYSGNYPVESSRLLVRRALTIDNATTRETISSGSFDAAGEYPITLADRARYQLIVENDAGDRRVLGAYDVRGSTTEELVIGSINVSAVEGESYAIVVNRTTNGDWLRLQITYTDEANATSNYVVELRKDDAIVRRYQQVTTLGTTTVTFNVSADQRYELVVTATRNGEQVTERYPVGGGLGIDLPLDSKWLGTFAMIFVGFVGALGAPRYAGQTLVGTVVFAGIMMYLQVVTIDPAFWSGAGLLAIGGYVYHKRRYTDA
jgi:hypothetical protein